MQVCYARQPFPSFEGTTPIFLVGPTPREPDVESWRPAALRMLENLRFEGPVLVPEPEDHNWPNDFLDQVEWEHQGLQVAAQTGCIAAWVPRNLEKMPGFTTNVEFGLHVDCGRFVYGRPDGAPKTGYLDWLYTLKTGKKPKNDLASLLRTAIGVAKG